MGVTKINRSNKIKLDSAEYFKFCKIYYNMRIKSEEKKLPINQGKGN
jgi:hypothetical protein